MPEIKPFNPNSLIKYLEVSMVNKLDTKYDKKIGKVFDSDLNPYCGKYCKPINGKIKTKYDSKKL